MKNFDIGCLLKVVIIYLIIAAVIYVLEIVFGRLAFGAEIVYLLFVSFVNMIKYLLTTNAILIIAFIVIIVIACIVVPMLLKRKKIYLWKSFFVTYESDAKIYQFFSFDDRDYNENYNNQVTISDEIEKRFIFNRIINFVFILYTIVFLICIYYITVKTTGNPVAYITEWGSIVLNRVLIIVFMLLFGLKVFAFINNKVYLNYNDHIGNHRMIDLYYMIKKNSKVYIGESEDIDKGLYNTKTKYRTYKIYKSRIGFIKQNVDEPFCIKANGFKLYLYNDFLVFIRGFKCNAIHYDAVVFSYKKIVDSAFEPPNDSIIVDRAWRYSNKDGSRDRRIKYNDSLKYFEIGSLAILFKDERIFLNLSNAEESSIINNFVKEIEEFSKLKTIYDNKTAKKYYETHKEQQ